MIIARGSSWGWSQYSNASPSTTPGASITPGSGAEGSYGTSITAANDVYAMLVWICAGNTTGTQRDILVDIGVDQAGGTSYTAAIQDILCSQAQNAVQGGQWFYFPYFIKASSTIAARARSNSTSTVRVGMILFGRPTHPELVCVGNYSATLGASGNAGTGFTPGNSGSEGSWVSLGTLAQSCWWFQLCVGIANATVTSLMYYIDLATGDGSNKHMIIENMPIFLPGTAEVAGQMPALFPGYYEVPSGGTLYVRGTCSGTAVTGFSATAVCVGG